MVAALGCEQILGLDLVPYDNGSSGGLNTAQGGGGSTSTAGSGGAGGVPTTSTGETTAGGTGGGITVTTTGSEGGGGTGGVGGTGGTTTSSSATTSTTSTSTTNTGPTTPTSCQDALDKGVLTSSGTVVIDPDGEAGPAPAADVYCDQETDGGGWALVLSSNGSEAGTTTAFWNIPYAMRFETKTDPPGPPEPGVNYYAGWLYRYGKQYRDDVVDTFDVEIKGVLRAKATGINETTMKFTNPMTDTGNLSQEVYINNFVLGWSSADYDNDAEAGKNCAVDYMNVTQHYGGCWAYNLGATNDAITADGVDLFDMGWGPHILNSTITQINSNLPMGSPQLTGTGGPSSHGSRLKRISRFTRW